MVEIIQFPYLKKKEREKEKKITKKQISSPLAS